MDKQFKTRTEFVEEPELGALRSCSRPVILILSKPSFHI